MSQPRSAVVGVGDELLAGVVVNTNAAFIGERLAAAGIPVQLSVCVGDVEEEIVRVLRGLLEQVDVVIVTGGLGPTHDDRTREALARLMNVPLVVDEEALGQIQERFARYGRTMATSNVRQAERPEGAQLIANPWGTAPGVRVQVGAKLVFAIPGVPRECQRMLDERILPEMRERYRDAQAVRTRVLRCVGIPESDLAERLADLSAAAEPRLAFLPGAGEVRVRFVASGAVASDCDAELDRCEVIVRERCGVAVYGTDDETLEEVCGALLTRHGLTVATAESCTAGLVASRIAAVPGASAYLRGAAVAYTEAVKTTTLGVSSQTLAEHGAVSAEVAAEMAKGAVAAFGSDLAVSVTCSAGPEPQGQDVGTTFVGVAGPDGPAAIRRLRIPGDRGQVRLFASTFALDLLRRHLLGDA